MKNFNVSQKGFVLPMVLVMLALLVSGAGFFLAQGSGELKANVINRDYELCILTAKNAMAVVQAAIEEDRTYVGTEELEEDENGGFYGVKITWISENQGFLEIESHYNTYVKKFTGEFELIKASMDANKTEIAQFKWRMIV